MVTYELVDCPFEGYIEVRWTEYEDALLVRSFRHKFKEELPIGAVFEIMKKHYERAA
jgi:hypothetical protein